jgi:hypothetical protein
MKILKVIRRDTEVEFHHEVQGHMATDTRKITAHEAPLKAFDDTFQKLADIVVSINELGQEYKKGINVTALTIHYTAKGTRSATIAFTKELDATGKKTHPWSTPQFRFEDAAEGEEGRMECVKKHAQLIESMIEHVEAYANGERQQRLLPLDDGKGEAAEPAQGDVLKFSTPPAGEEEQEETPAEPAKKKRGRPAKKK